VEKPLACTDAAVASQRKNQRIALGEDKRLGFDRGSNREEKKKGREGVTYRQEGFDIFRSRSENKIRECPMRPKKDARAEKTREWEAVECDGHGRGWTKRKKRRFFIVFSRSKSVPPKEGREPSDIRSRRRVRGRSGTRIRSLLQQGGI